jgi:hypothetical protein
LGGSLFEASLGKTVTKPNLNPWLGTIVRAWKDLRPGQPEHKVRPYLENNQIEKGWGVTQVLVSAWQA